MKILTLIYSTFNPNFSLTLIYVYMFINRRWIQWWMMWIEREWSRAMAQKENGTK
jgi:hypothetical protein